VKVSRSITWSPPIESIRHVSQPCPNPETTALGARPFSLLALSVTLVLAASDLGASPAPEYLIDETTAPSSVEGMQDPMGESFKRERPLRSLFRRLKTRWERRGPFLGDATLVVEPRNYYLTSHNDGAQNNEAWALGGSAALRSGWWRDRLRLGAVDYTSQRLYGPEEKDGTGLLKPVQDGFSVLGQAYAEARIVDGLRTILYRQTFKLPYVNGNDSRMVPNTFEAYTVARAVPESLPGLGFSVSHLRKMKTRDSDDFVSMSKAAGFAGTDKGLSMGGARYSFSKHLNLGAIDQYAWDYMNTFYAEGNGVWRLTESLPLRLSAQYTKQQEVGSALGGHFDTHVYGGRIAASHHGAILSLAFSRTSDNNGIQNPFGGYPGYLSIIVKDFNRAGEDAWLVGLSYDLGELGLEGLSAFTNLARGNTPDSGARASPDQTELDLTIDYRPSSGPLQGLWLRLRSAFVDQSGEGAVDVRDHRVILNYTVPVL
jgi:hypothetical protein